MAEITLRLKPWQVPNFVQFEMPPRPRQEGFVESPGVHVSEVSAEALARLCDEFRAGVFEKAGKHDPSRIGSKELEARND